MNEDRTIGELLEKYPAGFSVGPAGNINRTLLATSRFVNVAREYSVPPANGGYVVVEATNEGEDNPALSDQ